jgi:hypothetical protein
MRRTLSIILILLGFVACRGEAAIDGPDVATPRMTASQVPALAPNETAASTTKIASDATETPTADPDNYNNLADALSALPVGANHVRFTNWALIKELEGFESITSDSSGDERFEFYRTALLRHAVPSHFALRSIGVHADYWGWESDDLDWETNVSVSMAPGYVLKFRDGYVFDSVLENFEERGFIASVYNGVTVYTHTMELQADWLLVTEFSILNTAVLADAGMLFLSIMPETVYEMVDAYQERTPSLMDIPEVKATVGTLGEVPGAFVSANACEAFDPEALLKRAGPLRPRDQIEAQLDDRPQLQDYETLGIGYRYDDDEPVGLIVMDFASVEAANADLESRRWLATEGHIQDVTLQTYSDVYFSLSDAYVEGDQIVFRARLVDGKPHHLFTMIDRDDLVFATCP